MNLASILLCLEMILGEARYSEQTDNVRTNVFKVLNK